MASVEWQRKLAAAKSSIGERVAKTRAFNSQIGPWLSRYRGGMPKGFFGAIGVWESGGRWASGGDPVLGEVGYYQIARSTPPKFGIKPEKRSDPETNVFLAGLEYNNQAVEQYLRYPSLVKLGTEDSWKLARLAFAIGASGTRTLIDRSGAAPGRVFGAVRSYTDQSGGVSLGRQSAGQVWFRVHAVDVQWKIGKQALGGSPSWPKEIPSPKTVPGYELSPQVQTVMRKAPNTALLFAMGGLFAYGAYKVTQR
jgi:hypothetical protein